jgi:hypothetical protein
MLTSVARRATKETQYGQRQFRVRQSEPETIHFEYNTCDWSCYSHGYEGR